jgi:hypothetical protein
MESKAFRYPVTVANDRSCLLRRDSQWFKYSSKTRLQVR